MSTEIPEIFRALLEHPFTLPNFEDHGKLLCIPKLWCVFLPQFCCNSGNMRVCYDAKRKQFVRYLQHNMRACELHKDRQLIWTFGICSLGSKGWQETWARPPAGAIKSPLAVSSLLITFPAHVWNEKQLWWWPSEEQGNAEAFLTVYQNKNIIH